MLLLACRYLHGKTFSSYIGRITAIPPTILRSLLTASQTTTTTTTTTASSTPTPTQCAASNNYGLIYGEDAYDSKSTVLEFMFPYDFAQLQPGQCCNLCAQTANCYGFTTGSAGTGTDLGYCELAIIAPESFLPPVGPNVSPACTYGQYDWPQAMLSSYVPGSSGGSGQGPCGIFPA